MAFYEVEGTSEISWRLLVEGRSESEAAAAAVRVAALLSDLRRERALRGTRHRVVGCRKVVATPARDRRHERPADETAGE
jgi:hypothetical protein